VIYKTKGLVLRAVKYGETSLVVLIYTESFGIQSYLVNGVRTPSLRSASKANLFQPATLLDLVVYHNELKNLQRLKEFKWAYLYQNIFREVRKNAIALFMVELLQKCLKQPESNPNLFYFIEDAFTQLDLADQTVTANFALYFILHLTHFLGFRINDDYNDSRNILDLQEGRFLTNHPSHPHYLEDKLSSYTSLILKTQQPVELTGLRLNQETRRELLNGYLLFYSLQISDFGTMKSLPVLQEVLD
jgi:DNA repair protein RecO (recombination protein O)